MTVRLNNPLRPSLPKLTHYLEKVNDSGWYTNFGPLHQLLTKRLEEYLGVENLLLVSNGTLALQVAYHTLNIKSALTTPFSFTATTSSLLWEGIETSFSDIDENTCNLCPEKALEALAIDPMIDAIVPTHVYGNPCDVESFDDISKTHGVKIIYDAAHAFGVNVKGKSVLSFGDASTLSFHATKVFHTVEGGAIIFKKKDDFERAKRLINFGAFEEGHIHEVGINAKLNEYQCAVGLTLLDEIDKVISHRASLFKYYRDALQDFIDFPDWYANSNYNGAYMPIKLKSKMQRSRLEELLKANDVQSRKYFSPSLDSLFTEQKVFSSRNSRDAAQTILCLPLHFYMTFRDIDNIKKKISFILGDNI